MAIKTREDSYTQPQWIYLKIYSTPKMADAILTEYVPQQFIELKDSFPSSIWFFTRYFDGSPHLRLRFKCSNPEQSKRSINYLLKNLKSLKEQNRIGEYLFEEYKPEAARYGESNIRTIEEIFYFQSEVALELLQEGFDARQKLFLCLELIDDLFRAFNFKLKLYKEIVSAYTDFFKGKLIVDKRSVKFIGKEYRAINDMDLKKVGNTDFASRFKDQRINLRALYGQLDFNNLGTDKRMVFISNIHMLANKVFTINPRRYEYILLEFLIRRIRSINKVPIAS